MATLQFSRKVAIVTGAGGGLGKCYALLLAERGAAVIVNDLGGTSSGEGSNKRVADVVVAEIIKKGGTAVANYNSVEDAEKIVRTALDNFGRIDILINNAGILRDRSFVRMSDDDWDLVQRVHLRGAFLLTRACWNQFRKQNFGRIIMTSSMAGLAGNFGQANYSAAKMGLVGLSNTLAIEGSKYNIHCNVIVPMAASRLTQGIIPPEIFDELGPEYIAPVVVWLVHDSCPENGGIFEVAGGWIGKYQWQRAQGATLRRRGKIMNPEMVRDAWDKVTDMTNPLVITSVQESMGAIMESIENAKESGVRQSNVGAFSVEKAIQHKFPVSTFSYSSKDVILYALGIGVSTTEPDHLRFLYENSESFGPLPTFGIVPMQAAMLTSGVLTGVDGLDVNLTKVLHGEQYLEVLHPLLSEDTLESHVSVADVLDKGSGAVIIIDVECYRGKQKVLRAQSSIFVVGAGKFGGKRSSNKVVPTVEPPARNPDYSTKKKIFLDQAAVYRMSGDVNPLHIDPDFAAVAGFAKPILHGLCTFGLAAREVLKAYAQSDSQKFCSMKARFVKPILPGQTMQVDMWQEQNRILIQCKNLDTGEIILSGGYVDLKDVVSSEHCDASKNENAVLKSDAVFSKLREYAERTPGLTAKVNALFQWNILKNGKMAAQWTVDLRTSGGGEKIYAGTPTNAKPQCTLTLEDDDMVDLVLGKLDALKAFMAGKLKLAGNIMLSRKLQSLFKSESKL